VSEERHEGLQLLVHRRRWKMRRFVHLPYDSICRDAHMMRACMRNGT
jgi:uncharacterized metal-binding protein